MRTLFWSSALFIAYVYVGYGALLMIWAHLCRLGRRDTRASGQGLAAPLPAVSVILAVRNEAARLPARIGNLLELDYPPDRLQIIVASDGSTDGTGAVLAPIAPQVELIELPPGGKAVALNAAAARARGEVLVFTDARQTFAPDALRALVAPLADPHVAGVSGELILGAEQSSGRRGAGERRSEPAGPPADDRRRAERRATSSIGDGVGAYWKYEKRLRRLESEVGSMLGATGAIWALRRSAWRPLPPGTILDDVLAPMRTVLAGCRVIFQPAAVAFDHTPRDAASETRRKVRTLAGNVQILWFEPRLLVPIVNPVWLQYMSHKVGRLLVPYALLALFASSLVLAHTATLYAAALFGQVAFYLHGGYGAWLEHWHAAGSERRSLIQRTGSVAFTFVMMNVSAVAGAGAALLGRRVWR